MNYWPLLSVFLSVTWGPVLDSQTWGFCSGSDGKRICVLRRRPRFDPWVGKMPWRRKWKPIPVFLPGKSHGQRSLLGYSPWGCKELDTTYQLNNNKNPHVIFRVKKKPSVALLGPFSKIFKALWMWMGDFLLCINKIVASFPMKTFSSCSRNTRSKCFRVTAVNQYHRWIIISLNDECESYVGKIKCWSIWIWKHLEVWINGNQCT